MTDEQQDNPLRQRLEELVNENNATIQKLSREGIQVSMEAIGEGRHTFWIEKMIQAMPVDQRYNFEIEWQEKVAKILDNTGRDARRQRLLAGGHKPKGGAGSIITPGTRNGGRPNGN